jgi:hypothetical protein
MLSTLLAAIGLQLPARAAPPEPAEPLTDAEDKRDIGARQWRLLRKRIRASTKFARFVPTESLIGEPSHG